MKKYLISFNINIEGNTHFSSCIWQCDEMTPAALLQATEYQKSCLYSSGSIICNDTPIIVPIAFSLLE